MKIGGLEFYGVALVPILTARKGGSAEQADRFRSFSDASRRATRLLGMRGITGDTPALTPKINSVCFLPHREAYPCDPLYPLHCTRTTVSTKHRFACCPAHEGELRLSGELRVSRMNCLEARRNLPAMKARNYWALRGDPKREFII